MEVGTSDPSRPKSRWIRSSPVAVACPFPPDLPAAGQRNRIPGRTGGVLGISGSSTFHSRSLSRSCRPGLASGSRPLHPVPTNGCCSLFSTEPHSFPVWYPHTAPTNTRWPMGWFPGRRGFAGEFPNVSARLRHRDSGEDINPHHLVLSTPLHDRNRRRCCRYRTEAQWRLWAGQRPWRGTLNGVGESALGPFSHLQRVIHLDAKVSHGALQSIAIWQ